MHSIGENCLLARWQQLRTLFWSQAEFFGKSFNNIPYADFAIQRRRKNREHQRLIIRNRHIPNLAVVCKGIQPFRRKVLKWKQAPGTGWEPCSFHAYRDA
jgi:hypothetical protein